MNKKMLFFNTLFGLLVATNACAKWVTSFTPHWYTTGWVLQITNNTKKIQNVHAIFTACSDDKNGTIQPGQTLYTWAGACWLKRIDIDGGTSFIGPFNGVGLQFNMFDIRDINGKATIQHVGNRPF